jgi:hypothetical protein
MSEKFKLKHVEPVNGEVKATFIINNLTSEDECAVFNYTEIQEMLSNSLLDSDRRTLYIEALNAIDNHNEKLKEIENLYDYTILDILNELR